MLPILNSCINIYNIYKNVTNNLYIYYIYYISHLIMTTVNFFYIINN